MTQAIESNYQSIKGSGQLIFGAVSTDVDVVDIGASGARVLCALPVGVGQRVVLRTWELASASAIDFECEVDFREGGAMALEIIGSGRRTSIEDALGCGQDVARACPIGW